MFKYLQIIIKLYFKFFILSVALVWSYYYTYCFFCFDGIEHMFLVLCTINITKCSGITHVSGNKGYFVYRMGMFNNLKKFDILVHLSHKRVWM